MQLQVGRPPLTSYCCRMSVLAWFVDTPSARRRHAFFWGGVRGGGGGGGEWGLGVRFPDVGALGGGAGVQGTIRTRRLGRKKKLG